jgi:hypothetical protein
MRTQALHLGFTALALLSGCASIGRTTLDAPAFVTGPAAAPAARSAAPDVQPEAAVAVFPPPGVRLAVVQSAAPATVAFVDPELGDLRAPKRVLGDRVTKGLKYGATPGAIFMSPGSPPSVAVAGLLLGVVGGAIGAVTGAIAGAIEDGVNQAGIPLDQLYLHTPTLVAAASDLVDGPRPLGDCVAERLAAPRPLSQVALADADESPNVAALAAQGFSHALVVQEINLRLVRDGARRSVTAQAQAYYSVYEVSEEPRFIWTNSVLMEGPARSFEAWTAGGASELRALAARACPSLAESVGADVVARLVRAEN